MAEDDQGEPPPITTDEIVRALARTAREFVDYAALFVVDGEGRRVAMDDAIREEVEGLISDVGYDVQKLVMAAGFRPKAWAGDNVLRGAIPGMVAFLTPYSAVWGRWFRERGELRVETFEWAAMDRGTIALDRWREGRPPLPRGWHLARDWDGSVVRAHVPPAIFVDHIGGGVYRAYVGEHESYDLDTPHGLFLKAIVEAGGRAVPSAAIKAANPDVYRKGEGNTNLSRLQKELPEPLRDAIESVHGYRYRVERGV